MNTDKARLDKIIEESSNVLIEEDIEYAKGIDTSSVVIPKSTLRRVRKRMKREEKGSLWQSFPPALRRSVAAMLCLCTVAFVVCMADSSVRKEFFGIFVDIQEKYADVFHTSEEDVPKAIEVYKEPAVQPRGTERRVILNGVNTYIVGFFNDDERILVYQQMVIRGESAAINIEGCEVSDTWVNDFEAKLFEYEDGTKELTWNDGSYAYFIDCHSDSITAKDILAIAESVR